MTIKFRHRLPGLLITVLLCLAMAAFMVQLVGTKLFPTKFLLLAGGVCALLALIVGLLTGNSKRMGRLVIGILLALLILAGLAAGTYYLTDAVNTLSDLTQVTVEITDMGIYVRQDDPAADLQDAAAYRFGILQDLDRNNTDTVLENLSEELQTGLNVQEFAGLEELVDGLLTQQVDAIVLNSAYLELLTEMENYADLDGQLRALQTRQVQTQVETVPVETEPADSNLLEQILTQEEVVESAFVMYISGIDSRTGLIAKSRSDVNILAVVNPSTRQVLLVSTPRDYYVPLPISDGLPDKLTHAGIYGVDVSMGTLEMLYGIDVDYYFRVNFSGFEKIIDALGGITVYSDCAFSTDWYSYTEGENHLDGDAALTFARERKSFAAGDRQRGKNQMAVIKGVIQKAMSPAILQNYKELMESISGCFETSMPYDKIAELVRNQLEEGGSWNVVSISVDGTGATKKPYSMSSKAYVMIPDQATVDAAIEKIQQVINGEILQ